MYLQSGQIDKGQSALCDRGGVRERARTAQSAQRRVCGIRAWPRGDWDTDGGGRELVEEEDANCAVRWSIIHSLVVIVMPGCVWRVDEGVSFIFSGLWFGTGRL